MIEERRLKNGENDTEFFTGKFPETSLQRQAGISKFSTKYFFFGKCSNKGIYIKSNYLSQQPKYVYSKYCKMRHKE